MKRAFTMMEIIFIIVIIGIISVMAISRFSATRNDALIVRCLHDVDTFIKDVANYYNTQGVLTLPQDIHSISDMDVSIYSTRLTLGVQGMGSIRSSWRTYALSCSKKHRESVGITFFKWSSNSPGTLIGTVNGQSFKADVTTGGLGYIVFDTNNNTPFDKDFRKVAKDTNLYKMGILAMSVLY